MNPNKAPGPDGFNCCFFQKAWSIIGEDVVAAVKEFFSSGLLLKELNSTIITLVPKVANPTTMSDFRPISCCNTLYKIIAKLLANKLKGVLHLIVGPSQSAFIPGRRIGDNILLAQELLRDYHKAIGHPRCTLMVDIMKAYDTFEWDFILATLEAFNIPPTLISWIKSCISSLRFSVAVNGELAGFFASKWGLRQGDPLSPYLFVIAMEALSLCIL
ncbi:putative RNA-directed DNA polymerase [Rosa chinensis]|uniref:Putative RNA-directed DNA polymerase n=1 Tax=Rosa chinensis TaxID=74649 RepID=A0A2P6PDM5_ROSCH|nr:putative RNA-directed DNA polymerase [Rosa chinensis]